MMHTALPCPASHEIVPGERICLSVIYLGKVDCDNARAAPSNGIEIARVLTNDQCHIQQMAAAAKCQVGQHAAEILLSWSKRFFKSFEKVTCVFSCGIIVAADASNDNGRQRQQQRGR